MILTVSVQHQMLVVCWSSVSSWNKLCGILILTYGDRFFAAAGPRVWMLCRPNCDNV